jgi:5-hydroxyisourate hydrolase-like protein (transthyretin family)
MNKRKIFAAALIIGLLAGLAAAQGPGQDSSGAIVGTVLDSATGGPLENAEVILSVFLIQGTAIDTVTTGTDGRFAFSDLATGGRNQYGLSVSLQGYISQAQTNIVVGQDETDTVIFYLVAGTTPPSDTGSFSGIITDSATGNPLGGALVILSSGFGPMGQIVDSMHTGSDGAYLFEGLSTDGQTNFTLSTTAPNYTPQSVSNLFLTDADPHDTVDFELVVMNASNSWVVYGVITADSTDGAVLEGALVEIKRTMGSELRYSGTTNQDGEYEILIPQFIGGYTVTASLAGYLNAEVQQRIAGDSTEIDLVMETDTGSGVETQAAPLHGSLSVFPNPLNAHAMVVFQLEHSAKVNVGVYSISGRLISTLMRGHADAGSYSAVWAPKGVSNGVYVLKVKLGDQQYSKRLLLTR